MYDKFFGLAQEPFSIAPDPRFLYMSERHREALAHLLYGLGAGGGFVLLTGEIGAGKTTVCRCFLEQIPRRCNVAYIFNPELTVTELLQSVCDELNIPYRQATTAPATVKDYLDPLNEFLLKTHAVRQDNVLIVDEAQRLSAEVLEQLRLLTNLETSERKLLQIILIGQPELRDMLARPELEQLEQRVIARYHLGALSQAETAQYIAHRLAVAGLTGANPFSEAAMQQVHHLARGVPRRINLLCDRALLGAYGLGDTRIDTRVVAQAAHEVWGTAPAPRRSRRRAERPLPAWGWLALGLICGAAGWAAIRLVLDAARPGGAQALAARAVAVAGSAASAAPVALPGSAAPAVTTLPAVPATPAASAPALVKLPAGAALQAVLAASWRSERQAWRELAPAWHFDPGATDPCAAAPRSQLRCFRGTLGTDVIRVLARPGFLTLRDARGTPSYVLLTRLDANDAGLRGDGGQVHSVALAALGAVWQGEFATLWRAPAQYAGLVMEGSAGPAVDWLATRLAALQSQPAPPDKQRFGAALKARVNAFQVAQGLLADGIAGPTTLMQLNRASGVDEPRLPDAAAAAATR